MAPHSSTLAWKIPWMEEPGRLQSMGSLESNTTERLHFHFLLSCIGEENGNPLQVFLPGESQERGSLVGCHLWARTELDTTKATQQQQQALDELPVSLGLDSFPLSKSVPKSLVKTQEFSLTYFCERSFDKESLNESFSFSSLKS